MRAGFGAGCKDATKFFYSTEAHGSEGVQMLVVEYEQTMLGQRRSQ